MNRINRLTWSKCWDTIISSNTLIGIGLGISAWVIGFASYKITLSFLHW